MTSRTVEKRQNLPEQRTSHSGLMHSVAYAAAAVALACVIVATVNLDEARTPAEIACASGDTASCQFAKFTSLALEQCFGTADAAGADRCAAALNVAALAEGGRILDASGEVEDHVIQASAEQPAVNADALPQAVSFTVPAEKPKGGRTSSQTQR